MLIAAPACAAPLLVPARDVTVEYSVQPRDRAPIEVRVAIEGGGGHLRITSADLPTAFLVDRPAGVATILMPILKLYATAPIGRFDPERTVLRRARFDRHGQRNLAGLTCTDWTAASAQGHAAGCITADGVILQGTAADAHGQLGTVRAVSVQYGALPQSLFRLPDGFQNAGSLPIEGFAAAQP